MATGIGSSALSPCSARTSSSVARPSALSSIRHRARTAALSSTTTTSWWSLAQSMPQYTFKLSPLIQIWPGQDVAAPFLVRARGGEVSFHQVGDVPGARVGHGGDHLPAPVAPYDPVLAHHPLDPFAVDQPGPGPLAARGELRVDPTHPVQRTGKRSCGWSTPADRSRRARNGSCSNRSSAVPPTAPAARGSAFPSSERSSSPTTAASPAPPGQSVAWTLPYTFRGPGVLLTEVVLRAESGSRPRGA